MVVNPVTIHPDQTLADALRADGAHHISGIPVVERGTGKLVGILTNRDVRFATDPRQPVYELMTKENLVTVREGVSAPRRRGCCTSTASRSCWWSTTPIAASA
jgi:IMP dehydrogenase